MSIEDAARVMLRKSAAALRSAKASLEVASCDRAVSDLYYSAFQAAVALMIIRKETSTKHTHVRAFVNRELANKGLLPVELAKMYNKLMDLRDEADYSPEYEVSRESVIELIPVVEKFNLIMEELVRGAVGDVGR